jgi:alpha-ketoglutarate-dependent taurine dioxygenase
MLDVAKKIASTELTPTIGARIGETAEALLAGDFAADIDALLETRGVLVFPGLNFTEAQQVAFTRMLGGQVNEFSGRAMAGQELPEAARISLDPQVTSNARGLRNAFFWHLDGSMAETPVKATMLSAQKLSPSGGDTEFCNTYAAYDALPEDEKAKLEGLRVVHAAWALQRNADPQPSYAEFQRDRSGPSRSQPLVWTHRSGRKSLVLGASAAYVEGMDYLESLDLLIRLRDWSTQPRFVYRHRWTVGDMVMWDNRGTMHRVLHYDADSGRLMLRTMLQGDEPFN